MKQEFNPQEWLDRASTHPLVGRDQCSAGSTSNPSVLQCFNASVDISSEVDQIIARIEANFADITPSYADWINLGFAFVHQFGEEGRKFYHRVSRFYPGYTKAETDKQYDQCQKSQGQGITIRTFFYLAKQAGIEVGTTEGVRVRSSPGFTPSVGSDQWSVGSGTHPSTDQFTPSPPHSITNSTSPEEDDSPPEEEQPTLPDSLFEQLPDFFKKVVVMADSKEERDMLLLGALVTLSSCLSKFSGYYGNRRVYPNLYLYVTAPAAAGKGNLVMCRNLVDRIDEEKSNRSYLETLVYDQQMREYNAMKNKDMSVEKPIKPPVRMLFIPANNSTTGFYQLLSDNEGSGLLFETEGDTLTLAFRTDYGNFSDGVRKAFHHEPISYYRRTDRENVRIRFPRLSMVISSTIGQLPGLIPNVENGLASRFMFYHMNLHPVWNDVLARDSDHSWDDHFNKLGQEFYSLYNSLKTAPDIDFKLSPEQHRQFNVFFARIQDKYLALHGMETLAIVRRLGLIAFRIMMVLTAMRIPETGDFSIQQECRDEDFQSALSIVSVLVRHASYVMSQLPTEVKVVRDHNSKEKFFEGLGEKFTNREFTELGKALSIPESTAKRYIAFFCEKGLITRERQGSYVKLTLQEGCHEKNESVHTMKSSKAQ